MVRGLLLILARTEEGDMGLTCYRQRKDMCIREGVRGQLSQRKMWC